MKNYRECIQALLDGETLVDDCRVDSTVIEEEAGEEEYVPGRE